MCDEAHIPELVAIQEQLGTVLTNQDQVAHAVAELRKDMAPIIDSLRCHACPTGTRKIVDLDECCGARAPLREEGPHRHCGAAHAAAGYCRKDAATAGADEPGVSDVSTAKPAGGPQRADDTSDDTSDTEMSLTKTSRSLEYIGLSPPRDASVRKVIRFERLLKFNEERCTTRTLDSSEVQKKCMGMLGLPRSPTFESKLDTAFAGVICINMVLMAFELDADRDRDTDASVDGWIVIACAFSVLFWSEFLCKLWLHGFRRHFAGHDHILHLLDIGILVTDTVQIIYTIKAGLAAMEGVPAASLFRLFRLVRILRLVRLLHSPIFKDLLTMVHSLSGGLITLGWSFLPFFLVLYTASLVCREMLGSAGGHDENVGPYFDTVPRSLLTMFRCSFGDFSSRNGVPIIEYVMSAYGLSWGFLYAIFVFFVSVGVFNVIAAVFLDSTLAVTTDMHVKKLHERLSDQELWYKQAYILIQSLLPCTSCSLPPRAQLSAFAQDIMSAEVARRDITSALRQGRAAAALRALDIDPSDDPILGDILDYDHTGHVTILDFVNGLKRLRGSHLRRSDVLSIDLMVRNLQEKVDDVLRTLSTLAGNPGGNPGVPNR